MAKLGIMTEALKILWDNSVIHSDKIKTKLCRVMAELSPFHVCVQRAVVQMDEAREQHITKLLNSVQSDQPSTGRDSRDGRASTSGNWQTEAKSSGHW